MIMERTNSNMIPALTILFFVLNIFLFVAIKAPPGHFDPANVLRNENQETMAPPVAPPSPEMMLDWKMVDQYVDGEWRVEKYQEFEIYFDEKGQKVKELPTNHFNYLKYWRYQ